MWIAIEITFFLTAFSVLSVFSFRKLRDALIRAAFNIMRKTAFWPILTFLFKFVRSLAAYRFVVNNKQIF